MWLRYALSNGVMSCAKEDEKNCKKISHNQIDSALFTLTPCALGNPSLFNPKSGKFPNSSPCHAYVTIVLLLGRPFKIQIPAALSSLTTPGFKVPFDDQQRKKKISIYFHLFLRIFDDIITT